MKQQQNKKRRNGNGRGGGGGGGWRGGGIIRDLSIRVGRWSDDEKGDADAEGSVFDTYPSCILVCFAGTGAAWRLQYQFLGDWPKLIYKYHEGRKTKPFCYLAAPSVWTASLSRLDPQTHSRLSNHFWTLISPLDLAILVHECVVRARARACVCVVFMWVDVRASGSLFRLCFGSLQRATRRCSNLEK